MRKGKKSEEDKPIDNFESHSKKKKKFYTSDTTHANKYL